MSERERQGKEGKRARKGGELKIGISTGPNVPLFFTQVSYAALIGARQVRTGHEKQVAVVEMSISNTHPSETQSESLLAFVPGAIPARVIPPFPYNTYDLLERVGKMHAIRG